MPRSARLWEPGQVLHVIARGHEGRPLFASDEDREFFTARMAAVFAGTGTACLAWALRVNHYHVLVRVGGTPPGEVFRCVNTPVAQRERRRRGDHGSVFQDRYFSRPSDGDGLIAARRRGRALLARSGWTPDDVLSWTPPPR